MLNKNELEKIAESFQKKADRAYLSYQETGARRYLTTHVRNDDIAEAIRAAADAADNTEELRLIRLSLMRLAEEARKGKDVSKEVVSEALMFGLIRPEEKAPDWGKVEAGWQAKHGEGK